MDLHIPDASRDVALKELLLMERHHLSRDDFRCLSDCEPAHMKTAIAALQESSRLGAYEDSKLAENLENININNPREQVLQEVRSIRKIIQSKLVGKQHSHSEESCNTCGHLSHELKKALNINDNNINSKTLSPKNTGIINVQEGYNMEHLRELGVVAASQFVGVGLGEVSKRVPGATAGQPNSRLVDLLVFGLAPAVASVYMKNLKPELRTALAVVGTQRIALNVASMAMTALPKTGATSVASVSVGMPSSMAVRPVPDFSDGVALRVDR